MSLDKNNPGIGNGLAKGSITLKDVARKAGVSRGTASNVFSRPEIVRGEMREKVLAAAKTLGYAGPDPRGRMLRAGKVNAIGVAGAWPLSYFFDDPFARSAMEGIGQVCDEAGAGLSLISAIDERQVAWSIQSALVDGFILFCMDRGKELVTMTRERGLPFVTLDFRADDAALASFWIDNTAGARQAAQHLVELGHRDVAILSLPVADEGVGPVNAEHLRGGIYTSPRERLEGYFDVLAAAGVEVDRIPIYETDNDEATTRAGMEFLFSEGRQPTALLAMSDRMALAAIDWLREHGIDVPGQVSIIGFDGVPEAARSTPPLTTIAQPMLEMGQRAARAILQPPANPERVVMPLRFLDRGTTAPPPSRL